MQDAETLIDRIYEAAALPDLWPGVLADIARYGGGEDALIFALVDGEQHAIVSPNILPHMADFAREGWPERSDRPARIAAHRHPGFITDLDVYTMDEIDRLPVYQDWLIPRGYGWGIGTYLPIPSGETLFVTVERAWARGPAGAAETGRMDRLRPHLARAALLSARLQMARAEAVSAVLDAVGLPACVLDANSRAVAMNGGCERLLGTHLLDGRRFTLAHPEAQALFADALATLHGDRDNAPRSIPLPGAAGHPPLVIHVLPIRRYARDIFTSLSAIVVITPVTGGGRQVAASILEGLFDLSPAEARVAREIARLATISEIADRFGASPETIRTQLRSIFGKTGTRRQTELSALLADVAFPPR